jgi:hypothetical protein
MKPLIFNHQLTVQSFEMKRKAGELALELTDEQYNKLRKA